MASRRASSASFSVGSGLRCARRAARAAAPRVRRLIAASWAMGSPPVRSEYTSDPKQYSAGGWVGLSLSAVRSSSSPSCGRASPISATALRWWRSATYRGLRSASVAARYASAAPPYARSASHESPSAVSSPDGVCTHWRAMASQSAPMPLLMALRPRPAERHAVRHAATAHGAGTSPPSSLSGGSCQTMRPSESVGRCRATAIAAFAIVWSQPGSAPSMASTNRSCHCASDSAVRRSLAPISQMSSFVCSCTMPCSLNDSDSRCWSCTSCTAASTWPPRTASCSTVRSHSGCAPDSDWPLVSRRQRCTQPAQRKSAISAGARAGAVNRVLCVCVSSSLAHGGQPATAGY